VDELTIQVLTVLMADIYAIKQALISKGMLSAEELQAHFPKTDDESKALFDHYLGPFLGPQNR
jgi:hypothetical protein